MILGMSLKVFTAVHVLISLVGIGSGVLLLYGFLKGVLMTGWNRIFLVTTILTSVTGFFFPNSTITPGIVLGVLSLVVLAVATIALYGRKLAGGWRRTYAITTMMALYFNVFVLVAQLFAKVPTLHALAPTGTELPFKVAQLVLLILFVFLITKEGKTFGAGTV